MGCYWVAPGLVEERQTRKGLSVGGVIWLQRSISAYEEKTAVSRRYLGLLVEVPDRAMISLRKIVC